MQVAVFNRALPKNLFAAWRSRCAACVVACIGIATPVASAAQATAQPVTQEPATQPNGGEAKPAPAAASDRWYVLEMMGGRAGWMHSRRTEAEGRITSESEMNLSIKRGTLDLVIKIETQFVETADGKPVSMRSVRNMSSMDVVEDYVFKDDGIEVTTKQAGTPPLVSKQAKPEGVWLTPAAAERFVRQRYKSGAKEIEVRTIDPSTGVTPIVAKRTIGEQVKIEALGRTISCIKTTVTTSAMAGVTSTEYVDDEGELVRGDTNMGGLTMKMSVASREEATGGKHAAPELMLSTFVKPDKRIKEPRSTTRAVYVLSVPEGEMPDLPTTGSQVVQRVDGRTLRLRIAADAFGIVPPADADEKKYLATSAMLNAADVEVLALTERALKGAGQDPAERAEAIRRFVYKFIKNKNLGTGFATASEVARNREGDCTEHGVLLAAMLRAAGIPSRVAVGLIYADQFAGSEHIFGYHMWSQAMLTIDGEKRWVDLDATLPTGTPYDATHITLGVSELPDGDSMVSMSSVATVIGRLSIVVEEIERK